MIHGVIVSNLTSFFLIKYLIWTFYLREQRFAKIKNFYGMNTSSHEVIIFLIVRIFMFFLQKQNQLQKSCIYPHVTIPNKKFSKRIFSKKKSFRSFTYYSQSPHTSHENPLSITKTYFLRIVEISFRWAGRVHAWFCFAFYLHQPDNYTPKMEYL